MYRALPPTVMNIWCKCGQCGLNHSGVTTLTRCYDLEGQGRDHEDEGQGHIINSILPPSMMHIWTEFGKCGLNHSRVIELTR